MGKNKRVDEFDECGFLDLSTLTKLLFNGLAVLALVRTTRREFDQILLQFDGSFELSFRCRHTSPPIKPRCGGYLMR